MDKSKIIDIFNQADKRYPRKNLCDALSNLFPGVTCHLVTDELEDGLEINKIWNEYLEWRYQTKGNSYVLSVRFANGLFWIQAESTETSYPEITIDILEELEWYVSLIDGPGSIVDSKVFKYESESGSIYTQDIEKLTCTCPNFKYRTGHFPIDDERRLCKHLETIFRCYPEYTPKSLKSNETVSSKQADGKTRFPRAMFDMYIVDIKAVLAQFTNIIERYEICGSYRRLAPMVSDLDVLIQLKPNTDWEKLLDYVEKIKGWQLISNIGRGEAKAAYMIDGFVHVDFKCVKSESWPFALMHFTGSKSTNIKMRRAANSMGYKLNEYGLFSEVDNRPVSGLLTEKDIYHFLGVKYEQPWER